MAERVPTEGQYAKLRPLADGSAGLSWRKRVTEPLLKRGWVSAELREPFYQWVRITPAGLIALAAAVERYGLPELGPAPVARRRVCVDCGSRRYRYESTAIEAA